MAVAQQIAAIRKSAESCDKAATEIIGTSSVGDVVRQGDLYLVCLDRVPDVKPANTLQLAPGSTQGSRHVATGDCKVYQPKEVAEIAAKINQAVKGANVPTQLIGPVVHCIGPATITHPEHGWKTLPADSWWAVVYQRQFAEEIRRVQD